MGRNMDTGIDSVTTGRQICDANRNHTRAGLKNACKKPLSAALMVVLALGFLPARAQQNVRDTTTAWKDGEFHVDPSGILSRSAIVLERPNLLAKEAMPLGNGRLGVSVWSADGLTLQLNRVDTLPRRLDRKSVV